MGQKGLILMCTYSTTVFFLLSLCKKRQRPGSKADLWVETRRNKLQYEGTNIPSLSPPPPLCLPGVWGRVRIGQGGEWLGMSGSTELWLSEEAGQERGEHFQDGVVGRTTQDRSH